MSLPMDHHATTAAQTRRALSRSSLAYALTYGYDTSTESDASTSGPNSPFSVPDDDLSSPPSPFFSFSSLRDHKRVKRMKSSSNLTDLPALAALFSPIRADFSDYTSLIPASPYHTLPATAAAAVTSPQRKQTPPTADLPARHDRDIQSLDDDGGHGNPFRGEATETSEDIRTKRYFLPLKPAKRLPRVRDEDHYSTGGNALWEVYAEVFDPAEHLHDQFFEIDDESDEFLDAINESGDYHSAFTLGNSFSRPVMVEENHIPVNDAHLQASGAGSRDGDEDGGMSHGREGHGMELHGMGIRLPDNHQLADHLTGSHLMEDRHHDHQPVNAASRSLSDVASYHTTLQSPPLGPTAASQDDLGPSRHQQEQPQQKHDKTTTFHFRGASFDLVNPHASLFLGTHNFETPAEPDAALDDYFSRALPLQTIASMESFSTISTKASKASLRSQHSDSPRPRVLYHDAEAARRNILGMGMGMHNEVTPPVSPMSQDISLGNDFRVSTSLNSPVITEDGDLVSRAMSDGSIHVIGTAMTGSIVLPPEPLQMDPLKMHPVRSSTIDEKSTQRKDVTRQDSPLYESLQAYTVDGGSQEEKNLYHAITSDDADAPPRESVMLPHHARSSSGLDHHRRHLGHTPLGRNTARHGHLDDTSREERPAENKRDVTVTPAPQMQDAISDAATTPRTSISTDVSDVNDEDDIEREESSDEHTEITAMARTYPWAGSPSLAELTRDLSMMDSGVGDRNAQTQMPSDPFASPSTHDENEEFMPSTNRAHMRRVRSSSIYPADNDSAWETQISNSEPDLASLSRSSWGSHVTRDGHVEQMPSLPLMSYARVVSASRGIPMAELQLRRQLIVEKQQRRKDDIERAVGYLRGQLFATMTASQTEKETRRVEARELEMMRQRDPSIVRLATEILHRQHSASSLPPFPKPPSSMPQRKVTPSASPLQSRFPNPYRARQQAPARPLQFSESANTFKTTTTADCTSIASSPPQTPVRATHRAPLVDGALHFSESANTFTTVRHASSPITSIAPTAGWSPVSDSHSDWPLPTPVRACHTHARRLPLRAHTSSFSARSALSSQTELHTLHLFNIHHHESSRSGVRSVSATSFDDFHDSIQDEGENNDAHSICTTTRRYSVLTPSLLDPVHHWRPRIVNDISHIGGAAGVGAGAGFDDAEYGGLVDVELDMQTQAQRISSTYRFWTALTPVTSLIFGLGAFDAVMRRKTGGKVKGMGKKDKRQALVWYLPLGLGVYVLVGVVVGILVWVIVGS